MKQEMTEQCLDRSSMEELYESMAPAIFAYIRSFLSSQEQAEDVLVEVFLAAFESKKFFLLNLQERLAWLRRVAHHKVVDCYRLAGRLPVATLEHLEKATSLTSNRTPEQIVIQREDLYAPYLVK